MGRLRRIGNFFITVESKEGEDVPREAASEDIEMAARAASERASAGSVGQPSQRRVREASTDPYAGTIEPEKMQELSRQPNLDPSSGNPFDDIYSAAGLEPTDSNEFTIYRVERLLNSQHIAGLGAQARAASVMVALEASGVSIDSVIEDAIARDRALDQYDSMLQGKLSDLELDVEVRNEDIERQITEFLEAKRAEISQNNERLANARATYKRWQEMKVVEEERLEKAIAPFVSESPGPGTE